MKLPTIGLSNFTYVILEMKWNEYIFFSKIYINLQQFQVISENKTQGRLLTT